MFVEFKIEFPYIFPSPLYLVLFIFLLLFFFFSLCYNFPCFFSLFFFTGYEAPHLRYVYFSTPNVIFKKFIDIT